MLLRSSSTPIFGSLLASSSSSSPYFSESPNHGPVPNPLERAHSDSHNKLFFPPNPSNHNHHHHQLNSSSSFHGCSLHLSSPVVDPPVGFRRVQSEGNLQNLAATDLPPPAKSHRRPSPVLETIPSFSLYSSRLERGLEDSVAEEEDELEEEEVAEDSSEFVPRSFAGEKGKAVTMGSPLFLAKGLGLENFGAAASSELILGMGGTGSNGGGGGGVGGRSVHVDSSGSQADMEAYYKKMVEEDPGNSLLLRNYAQFLHKSKGDLKRAEEYYSRAVLAEPGDGEVLSHYAKVIWELHHDRGRAGGYFEQAVQAAPQNSHVLASYANFLWETEDDEEEEGEKLEEEFGGDKVPVMAHPRSLSC